MAVPVVVRVVLTLREVVADPVVVIVATCVGVPEVDAEEETVGSTVGVADSD